jgi:hypothetical protein
MKADGQAFRDLLVRTIQPLKRDGLSTSQLNVAVRLGCTDRHLRRKFAQHVTRYTGEHWQAFIQKI